MTENTHGGQRPGAGRKPGEGEFAGGRPVSTRKLRTGQQFAVWREMPDGASTRLETMEVNIVSRTRIELVVVESNGGTEGEKVVLIS